MKSLNVLVACERFGAVRDAFLALGHNAWSCDLVPDAFGSDRHVVCDAREVIYRERWDLMIAHPPCTRLCNSGARWLIKPPAGRDLIDMWIELDQGAQLFNDLWNADHIPCRAIENPSMHKHARVRVVNWRDPQKVQPWQFAQSYASVDNEKKRTCWWKTDNLPDLRPTGRIDGSRARSTLHELGPSVDRAKWRSRFFPGMAKALAQQWSEAAINVRDQCR